MSDSQFEARKQKFIEQKAESLDRLEHQISVALKQHEGGNERAMVALHRARASALAAVERLRHVDEDGLDVAVQNADQALRTAYERLDAATAPEVA